MIRRLLLAALLLTTTGLLSAQQLAFPGAEGYAAYATGGRGGTVVHVTNLNASGAGSLADAVSKSNRIVVFDVGGIINITNASITIASNVTIAGQTAPGEGITIYGGRVIASGNKNIIVRYIRMRGGKSVNQKKCTLTLDNCENVILDHCDISWGPWDDVHITDANNITFQNCIISEGIEPQRFGAITDGTRNWTVCHCLWIDNKSRNPKMKCSIQYYNNVLYNFAMGIIGGHSAGNNYQDAMNNYFIAGPNTTSDKYFDDWTATDHLYSTGNYYDGNKNGVLDGRLITDHHQATPMQTPNFNTTHPMHLETAAEAYATAVDQVGASRVRDSHDKRLIDQLKSLGTKGAFIANEDDLGGIGTVAGGDRPTDNDNDGMPDEWELANGLNPNSNDANGKKFGNGWTNIENYINSLAAKTSFLSAPTDVAVKLANATTARLTWQCDKTDVTAIVIEMSEDGQTWKEVKRVAANVTGTNITSLTAGQLYYFRLKCLSETGESPYSAVVAVNDELVRPGGGTPAGTTTFTPLPDRTYRIINYATIPFNSGTSLAGPARYLCFNADGTLGTTETFSPTDPALLWNFVASGDGYVIHNRKVLKNIAAYDTNIGGENRIGMTDANDVLTINYIGDRDPSSRGVSNQISMYRINSPSNRNYQIRAKGFGDNWFWGSGTYDRADMIFTFVETNVTISTDIDVPPVTEAPSSTLSHHTYFDLSGRHLATPPAKGFFIERRTATDGQTTASKILR